MLSRLRRRHDEAGFTLVELVIAIAILGMVMAAIVAAMAVALRTNQQTEARLTESRDMQFSSTWFGDDVQNANRIADSGTPNCGSDAAAALVVKFANTDFKTPPSTYPTSPPDALRISYVLRNSADGSLKELHRLACGTGAPDDTVVAHTLSPVAGDAPFVTCFSATGSTAIACNAPNVRRVVMTLRQVRQDGAAPLTYELQGTRRSS